MLERHPHNSRQTNVNGGGGGGDDNDDDDDDDDDDDRQRQQGTTVSVPHRIAQESYRTIRAAKMAMYLTFLSLSTSTELV